MLRVPNLALTQSPSSIPKSCLARLTLLESSPKPPLEKLQSIPKVKISDPFIYLAPPSKAIAGRVLDGSNSPVPNAEVVAWREEGEGWSSTFTEEDGSYELTAGPEMGDHGLPTIQ